MIRRNPGLRATLDFVDVLRPAWWIARAWLAAWLLAAFFGMERGYGVEGAWWIVLLGFAVVSIQWGRGRWTIPGLRGLVVAGNVIAVVALLPVMAAAQSWGGAGDYDMGFTDGVDAAGAGGDGSAGEGLFFDGLPLENIYVYDAAGNKLSGVQLFDVDGKPLVPYRNAVDDIDPADAGDRWRPGRRRTTSTRCRSPRSSRTSTATWYPIRALTWTRRPPTRTGRSSRFRLSWRAETVAKPTQ